MLTCRNNPASTLKRVRPEVLVIVVAYRPKLIFNAQIAVEVVRRTAVTMAGGMMSANAVASGQEIELLLHLLMVHCMSLA